MRITLELLDAYAQCPQKAFLRCQGEQGHVTDYETLMRRRADAYQRKCIERLCDHYAPGEILSDPPSLDRVSRRPHRLILDASSETDHHSIVFPAIERLETSHDTPRRQYAPLAFSCKRKPTRHEKLLAAVLSTALSDWSSLPVAYAKIIYGPEFTATRVGLLNSAGRPTRFGADATSLMSNLENLLQGPHEPGAFLNDHCQVCEYRDRCLRHARERDDLTLLHGLHRAEIEAWRERGIFTVTQLAYTFRPKATARSTTQPKRHSQSLQAMAIRDGTTYVRKLPELPTATTRVYMDVEGVPDSGLFYLIGIMIVKGIDVVRHQFWANGWAEQEIVWQDFLHALAPLDDYVLIHFGGYEMDFVQEMHRRCGDSQNAQDLLSRMFDLHAAIRTNVFFPVYSNRLKEIASHLGFHWQGPVRSGIDSIVWRSKWEMTGEDTLKDALLRYNYEDCLAAMSLFDHLIGLSHTSQAQGTGFVATDDLPSRTGRTFGSPTYAIPAFKTIAKCAYFKYQHDKVFFRVDKHVRKSTKRLEHTSKRRFRPNTTVVCKPPGQCPKCHQREMKIYYSAHQRCIKNLKFLPAGVKRWVVQYKTHRYYCRQCGHTCYSPDFPTKQRRFGHGVACWAVYQHVAARQSFKAITEGLGELFGYRSGEGMVKRAQTDLAAIHETTEETLLARIRSSGMVCVDETKFTIKGCIGYVWAFSGPEIVVYRFRESREGAVLEEVLDGFEGVLVSDFYGAYDSQAFFQQKCLIHLTRDINDDLTRAPFDEELKELARRFTDVMTPIIEAIDNYGLKSRHLRKFIRHTERLRNWIATCQFTSAAAQRYQKRFDRYGDRLFTFLNYDGVPWNNNAAENALKLIASRRRLVGGLISAEGMKSYLVFLSIYQTLRRKGGSFLRFLLSRKTDVFEFLGE